ncbi:Glutathionyl-hydroquinone reductase YqjG [Porphyridium purpureum]|uniref:Glutathionyl-hydroquinone reductase YqjG n=1 Tax=Porphyridium purpureum TaxID=35688 RepID=A0A5J4YW55_PORPP|nr:Glutathionyl-hydroquinone reductase YqjG [Porphyridium purpureum]|eukprot:POR3752..scf227_4
MAAFGVRVSVVEWGRLQDASRVTKIGSVWVAARTSQRASLSTGRISVKAQAGAEAGVEAGQVKQQKADKMVAGTHLAAMDDVSQKGEFKRKDAAFRDWISADPSAKYPAEAGRYRLYVSYACPWAHRTLITRKLKGLEDVIDVRVVNHYMGDMGWTFPDQENDGATPEDLFGFKSIRELYFKACPEYGGRFTVPVLWDKKTNSIVSNESKEIIVMLNREFQEFAANSKVDLLPAEHAQKIEALAEHLYTINNGVYRCGFARSQEAYDEALRELFACLDEAEEILSKSRYIYGNMLTLADVRLWTTLIRFDMVYVGHFKTNLRRIQDYPNLYNYMLELYQMDAFRSTTNFTHIKHHYYGSHPSINPFGVIPGGPLLDFDVPHDRNEKFPIA